MAEDLEAAPHRFASSNSTLSALSSAQQELRPHEVTVERLRQSEVRLEELEQQKTERRRARFREQREVHSQKSRVEREEARLRQDEEKMRQTNEQYRKTETRMETRVKDLWNDHIGHIPSLSIGEASKLARLEEQQEVLDTLTREAELLEIDSHLTGSIWEDAREVAELRAASKALAARKKENAKAVAELARLRLKGPTSGANVGTALVPTVAATPVKGTVAPASSPGATTAAIATCAQATGAVGSSVASPAAAASCAPVESSAAVSGPAALSSPDGSSALSPPPAKAAATKGKGKGKGVAPRLPPPPCKAAPPPAQLRSDTTAKKSNMLNLHWKVLKGEPPTDPSSKDGGFYRRTAKLAIDFEPPAQATLEASARNHRRMELGLRPETFDNASASTAAPMRDTVFSKPGGVNEMPSALLEAFFQARATVKSLERGTGGNCETLLDKKFLQMIGIALQKHVMAHKTQGGPEASVKKQFDSAVLSIKRAVLQCNYKVATQEVLVIIRTVLMEHKKDNSPVTKRVQEHGEASLLRLAQSAEHRMIHEILKVPQIDERLESMLFHTEFGRLRKKCLEDTAVLKQALEVLDRKRALLKTFFQTALKMGQGLNSGSRAPQAENGFQLTSWEKLVQTKSSKFPKHDVLHFVLALMQPSEAEALFTSEDIALLNKAKVLKSHTVHQDCQELVEGFYGLRDICDTGNYKSRSGRVKMERRRKTIVPGSRPDEADSSKENEAPIDTDDCFHDTMKEFVEENLDIVSCITEEWYYVFTVYKELGKFFGDVNAVYPPPRDENSSKTDLLAIFHRLAEHVRVHREEVDQDGLRELIKQPPVSTTSVADHPADGSATTDTAPSAPQASTLPPAVADASTSLLAAPPQASSSSSSSAALPTVTLLQTAAMPPQAAATRHVGPSFGTAASPAQIAGGPPSAVLRPLE